MALVAAIAIGGVAGRFENPGGYRCNQEIRRKKFLQAVPPTAAATLQRLPHPTRRTSAEGGAAKINSDVQRLKTVIIKKSSCLRFQKRGILESSV